VAYASSRIRAGGTKTFFTAITTQQQSASLQQIDLSVPDPNFCFLTTSTLQTVSSFPTNVMEFQEQHPSFRFYMFTNLEELHPPGWTKIVTPNSSYSRFITHSRYGKFLAWLLPESKECGAAFYVDGINHSSIHKVGSATRLCTFNPPVAFWTDVVQASEEFTWW
jgi:hypothetical protein